MFLKTFEKIAIALVLGITLWMAGFAPVKAAGTTPLALVPQVDSAGNVASGCQVNFYVAGTVATRQTVYADFGLTTPLANPLSCDQSGRVPMHWLADGLIHIQLTTSAGVPIVDTTMQVLGPSSGGGAGGGTVDPTALFQTGDEKTRYGTGVISGFVRENGLTIGNATSGATERANADTQALWIYLYNTDANLAVSGGRTGNALNDFNASKQLTLPDMRGRINGYLADMGNLATTVLTAATCASPSVLGFACGAQTHTLTLAELPTGITSANASQSITVSTSVFIPTSTISWIGQAVIGGTLGPVPSMNNLPGSLGNIQSLSGNNSISVTSTNTSGSAHTVLPPIMLKTIYIRL